MCPSNLKTRRSIKKKRVENIEMVDEKPTKTSDKRNVNENARARARAHSK